MTDTKDNPWLNEPLPDRPADPNCHDCRGRGFYYEAGYARTCDCRYSDPRVDGMNGGDRAPFPHKNG